MDVERNRALTRRWFEEVWNQGREQTIDELFDPDGIVYGLADGAKPVRGPDGFRSFYNPFRSAFSNLKIVVEDVIAEGDKTVTRLSFTGDHTGQGLGVPPTGRSFRCTGIVIIRWTNGKAVESWNEFDAVGMMQQLNPPQAGMKLRA